ncbi:ethylene-overproduction protein 1 [Cryptomeria japonica]|uniref:ethylene-overproduction protein 1 n=1 Tax=Cryptomeria japonica TaxID=3369 RepID=UPI0025AC4413|nr:ethylene-overproduction protein 1 [Cryptomeria japonica]
MTRNFILEAMRSLRLTEGCKGHQVYAVNPGEKVAETRMKVDSPKYSARNLEADPPVGNGLCVTKLLEPSINPHLRLVDHVETLASIYGELERASDEEKSGLYLEQSFVFRGLEETKLLRRSLRSARQHASRIHEKIVFSAWLRYEKREEELDENMPPMHCSGRALECPKAALVAGYLPLTIFDPCPCRQPLVDCELASECSTSAAAEEDVVFCIGDGEVACNREKIAALSIPFHAMLFGCFTESQRSRIIFSDNGITLQGMKAVNEFSKTGCLDSLSPQIVLELLSFANKFCCEKMKSACDQHLAGLVYNMHDAEIFIEYGLEENAELLVASCLQVFLRELPKSLQNPQVSNLLCKLKGGKRLAMVGHSSFALYSFLSQVAMENDMASDASVKLLERLRECASSRRQRALALHQLGCVMLERKQYVDAQNWFEAAAEAGHVYSLAGVARAKFKRGHRYSAYKEANGLISCYKPAGWMYQERSLYCCGKEKMMDLNMATELDPTLPYPYRFRAAVLMDENKVHAAIAEINRILGFKVSPDCLELRAWFCLALQDYDGALRDIRALLTLDPNYLMYSGRVPADQLLRLLCQHVEQWTKADCWMQLYDRWSCVDDIGSLAVVHQMLENEPEKGLLRFRQSLLLLRLNCPKAAMRSLRLARKHASSEHEKLVYEGWILYDTGHREEALQKAEESITIQRSFEAFFLKAYALADTSLDPASAANVVVLLEEALKCPSDGLRKGQALNNLGSVYVDCDKLDLAAACYISALNIRHTRAHQGLARVYHLKNDRKTAYEEMTKLIEKARNNASAFEKRSEYCERDMAKADLSMATQLDPLRTYPYRYRAAVLMDDRRENEAISELSKAIAFKTDLQLLHLRGAFHESIGDTEAAVRDCQAALSVDPNHGDTIDLYNRARGRQ